MSRSRSTSPPPSSAGTGDTGWDWTAGKLDSDGLCDLLLGWCARYPIVSVEDPLGEDDPEGLRRFTAAAGATLQVIGDDFLVTNAARVEAAAREGSVNAVLIKVNQAGTVTEAKAALDAGRLAGFGTIVSARSGETEDVAIAHLAVGVNAGQLKVGSFARSEQHGQMERGPAHRRRFRRRPMRVPPAASDKSTRTVTLRGGTHERL